MKKRLLIVTMIIVVAAIIIALIPFFDHIPSYLKINEYGTQYTKEYISDDGHITFMCNNKKGLYGTGGYTGMYTDDNGTSYEVDVVLGVSSYARTENDIDTEVYAGSGRYSIYRKAYIIKVDEVDLGCSVYEPGDKIIFRESNCAVVDNVQRTINTLTIHTEEDVLYAFDSLVRYFISNYAGCELTQIKYDEDKYSDELEYYYTLYGYNENDIVYLRFDYLSKDGKENYNEALLVRNGFENWKVKDCIYP